MLNFHFLYSFYPNSSRLMKKVFLLLACCGLLSMQADAQTVKKQTKTTQTTSKQEQSVGWSQLEAFHKVLSKTFHPAEKGDFKPVRERMPELKKAMSNLIGNPFPEQYQTDDMKILVAQLDDQIAILHKMVDAKAEDKEVMIPLGQAHEIFHKISGVCKGTDSHKG